MTRSPIKQKSEAEDMTLLLHKSTKDIIESAASVYHTNTTTIINMTLSDILAQSITYLQLPKYKTGDTTTKLHIQISPEVKQKIKRESTAFGLTDSRFTETVLNNVLSQLLQEA